MPMMPSVLEEAEISNVFTSLVNPTGIVVVPNSPTAKPLKTITDVKNFIQQGRKQDLKIKYMKNKRMESNLAAWEQVKRKNKGENHGIIRNNIEIRELKEIANVTDNHSIDLEKITIISQLIEEQISIEDQAQ
ncbi:hypothetical protein HHI36_005913, partial [Cryptolaemus montrouzieri]